MADVNESAWNFNSNKSTIKKSLKNEPKQNDERKKSINLIYSKRFQPSEQYTILFKWWMNRTVFRYICVHD